MKSEILILKNTQREDPGIIGDVLSQHKISFDKVEIDSIQSIKDVREYKAMIVLGGPASANDTTFAMLYELNLIRQAVDVGLPFLGICLGLQTLVKATGGEVVRCPVPEVGFRDSSGSIFTVRLTDAGRKDQIFSGLPETFRVFELHGETVKLLDEMTLLGSGNECTNQVVRVGKNAYGFQCHFELNEELLECWMKEDADLKKINAAQLRADFKLSGKEYKETGIRLFTNFLKIAGIIN